MSSSTNSLVAKLKRIAAPAGAAATILFAASFLIGRNVAQARAASDPAPQVDANSIAPLLSLDDAIETVAAHVMPAVVNISVTAKDTSDENSQDNGGGFGGIPPQEIPPEFRHFFFFGPGQGQQQQPQYEHAIGSGFIISPDGYIVTNHHVVDGATRIEVMLHDRRVFPAKVVGVDKLDDLAVVKIDATDLPTVQWGDSGNLKPGETVLAFGSPFGSLRFSVTRGIVSAVNRGVSPSDNARAPRDYIQTDAAINPGNSGGPLVNAYGQVVGVDTFIVAGSGGVFAGAGFAIPSQLAEHYANEIVRTGKVEHGYLGMSIEDVTPQMASFFKVPDASGAVVGQVVPDSPASHAGIKQGDVVRTFNGRTVEDASNLQVDSSESTPGTPVTLGILRDGQPMTIHVTLGEYHANGEQAQNSAPGATGHAELGLTVQNLTPDLRQQLNVPDDIRGVAIQSVRSGSAADFVGLAPGNVIMQVDRHPVTTVQEFENQMQAIPADHNVLLLVWSQGGTGFVVVQPNPGSGNNQ